MSLNASIDATAMRAFRDSFPALQRWVYMDVAGRGVLSTHTRQALDRHLDERMFNGGDKDSFFALIETTRARFAQLINAQPEEVSFTKNISEGLNMVATGIDWRAGDNVILCAELEHPNNVYPWLNLQKLGVEVRFVKPQDYHIPIDQLAARIDERTRCVTVSTVTFAPGYRTPVKALGEVCRARGVPLLVDAAQSAGILHTDVEALGVDALSVSTQKGLLALYGMGFLYVKKTWAEQLHPAYLARFGVDLGKAHEAAMGDYAFSYAPGARRFDLGNFNFAATAAVNASMIQLMELGTQHIEAQVLSLTRALVEGFLAMGIPVAGGEPGPHLAGIVTIGNPSANHYGTDEDRFNRLYEYLGHNDVKLSIRRGMLRFSLHAYNNREDVDRVLDLTRRFFATA
jgi:selenocysteine lyase/cysteine desulfurase